MANQFLTLISTIVNSVTIHILLYVLFLRSHALLCIVPTRAKKIQPSEEVCTHNDPDVVYIYTHPMDTVGINWLLDSIREQYNQINEQVTRDIAVQVF